MTNYIRASVLALIAFLGIVDPAYSMEVISSENKSPSRMPVVEYVGTSANDEIVTFFAEGSKVACLFWGPYLHVDKFAFLPESAPSLSPLFSQWAGQFKEWCGQKCQTEKFTKISFEIPHGSPCAEIAEHFLTKAGFQKKAYTYKVSLENAKAMWPTKLGSLEAFDPHICPLTLQSSFLASSLELFKGFNPTMNVPGLFEATLREVLNRGGKVFVHQSSDAAIDGILAFAPFSDKDGLKCLLVDSLYVAESSRLKNVGSKLMRKLLQEATSSEVKTLHWETGMGRGDAQDFYKKLNVQISGSAFRYTPPTFAQVVNLLPTALPDLLGSLQQDPGQLNKLLGLILKKKI